MKRFSGFIVSKRYWILGVMLCLTIICAILSARVSVNTDLTKYLPDDSSMKIGMTIMEDEFAEMDTGSTIRVMAEGLTEEQKTDLLAELEALPHVDSVAHDDSEDYNKGDYSLFTISTSYEYGSEEETSIEDALENDFGEYQIVFQNDNDVYEGLTPSLLIAALVILLTILFVMSESWFEPLLFLLTIGFAVVINAGTNIFMVEISNITNSITALLQLVLSMDYSIILINRYRQEKATGLPNQAAMAAAVQHSFSSVASSSLTTVVGLAMLAFMNFKIGMDLGIVLAKGVFISMVCVITVLPCLILMCDRLIARTAKKAPHIPMGGAARFSLRFRYVLAGVFVAALLGFHYLQGNTDIAFTLENEDPIADVFPSTNMLVMIYDNADEEHAALLAEELEENGAVKQVLGYPNLLGRQYTAQALADSIGELGDSLGADLGDAAVLDPELLELVYYHYYDGETGTMTMSEFLKFLSEDILTNDTFAGVIGDDMREQADSLAKFADSDGLTTPKSIRELADFFGMDADAVKNLMMLYYTEYGGMDTGVMTLPAFASFAADEVANDPDYGALFDEDTLSQLERLKAFTDVAAVTTPKTCEGIAELLGMNAETVKLLFVYYYAQTDSYTPGTMTLPEFVSFLQNDVMNSDAFSSYLDNSTATQISTLAQYTDKTALRKRQTASQLASALGMDKSMVSLIFSLYYAGDVSAKTMTLAQFTSFLNDDILNNALFASSFDDAAKTQLKYMNSLIQCAASGQSLTPEQMASMLSMDETTVTQLYFLYLSANDTAFQQEVAETVMTLADFLALAKAQASGEQQTQLEQAEQLVTLASSGQGIAPAQMAPVLGMDETTVTQLYLLFLSANDTAFQREVASAAMTLPDFLTLAKAQASGEQLTRLEQMEQIVTLAVSGQELTAAELAAVTGMKEDDISNIFSCQSQNTGITVMTLPDFLTAAAALAPDDQQLQRLNQIVGLAASGTQLDAAALASCFGMEETQVRQLIGLMLAADKTIALPAFTGFLADTVLADEAYAGSFDGEARAQITALNRMVQYAADGTALDAAALASCFGMEETQVWQLIGLALAADKTIALPAFTGFLADTVLADEAYAGSFDDAARAQLTTLNQMIQLAASGAGLDTAAVAAAFGMDESMVTLMFRLYFGGKASGQTMSLEELVDFLLSDFAGDPVLGGYLDSDTVSQLQMMQTLIQATVQDTSFSYGKLASLLGMDSGTLRMLFTLHDAQSGAESGWNLSLRTVVNFLLDNSGGFSAMMDEDALSQLSLVQAMIEGSVNGTAYSAEKLAELTGMDSAQLTPLYLLYFSRYGDTSTWQLPVQTLVGFLYADVMNDPDYAGLLEDDTRELLAGAKAMTDAVVAGEAYTAASAYEILSALTDELDENMVDLLYFYNASQKRFDPSWTLSMEQMLQYLCDHIVDDPRFAPFINAEMRGELTDMQKALEDGVAMLKSDSHSRLILYTTLPTEGVETTAFLAALHEACGNFSGTHYLIGTSAMNYEMAQTFDSELQKITLLTSIAIFLIVLLTFRNLLIPLILVLLVQCSVYITVTVVGLQGYSIYFLALLIVECILMGSTIDYGILFTNYYLENKNHLPTLKAIAAAYAGSIHTIMTSGLILVLVTGILGYTTSDLTIAQIVRTISTGSLCAILMILFILPGILSAFGKLIHKGKRKKEKTV